MGEFLITAPDGKQYRVIGDTKEGALAALQKKLGQGELAAAHAGAVASPVASPPRKSGFGAPPVQAGVIVASPLPDNPALQSIGPGPTSRIDPALYDIGAIGRRFVEGSAGAPPTVDTAVIGKPTQTPGGRMLPAGYDFVAALSDGGEVYRKPDGLLAYVGSAISFGSAEDQERIAAMLDGSNPAEVLRQKGQDDWAQTILREHPLASNVAKALQGVPFLGQYADEAIGKLSGDQAMQNVRGAQDAMERQHPGRSTALKLSGAAAGTVPAIVSGGPAVLSWLPRTLGGRMLAGAATGGGIGALEGAISGAGRGNDGDRVASALSDAKTGAFFGGAIGGAAPAVSSGVKALVNWARTTDAGKIAKVLGISDDAAEALKPDLAALDFEAAVRNLEVAGPKAMLADAGQPMREALDTAITGGSKAARIGIDAVSNRAAEAGGKLGQIMDAVFGNPQGVKATARSIAERTAPARSKAYAEAYDAAIDYASDAGRKIEAVLERIPSKTFRSAIDEANDAMRASGVTNRQIMAEVAEDGAVAFKEMPNVQQLDELKKALGTIASEVDSLGRPTAAASRALKLARDLKQAIGEAVPSYLRAVKLGGDKIEEDNLLRLGRRMFAPSTTREEVRDAVKGASLEALDAARRGVREFIDDAVARVRRAIDDPAVDTPETAKLLASLSSRDAREKVAQLLGEAKTSRFFAALDEVGKHFATKQAIATGSATARRTARKDALDAVTAPGAFAHLQSVRLVRGVQDIAGRIMGAGNGARAEANREILAEIATALTSIRGPEARAALKVIEKALRGEPVAAEAAQNVGRFVAGALGLGVYVSKPHSPLSTPPLSPALPLPSFNALNGWREGDAGALVRGSNALRATSAPVTRNALAPRGVPTAIRSLI